MERHEISDDDKHIMLETMNFGTGEPSYTVLASVLEKMPSNSFLELTVNSGNPSQVGEESMKNLYDAGLSREYFKHEITDEQKLKIVRVAA